MASPQEILDAIRLGELRRRTPQSEIRLRRHSAAPAGMIGDELTFDPDGSSIIARLPLGDYMPSELALQPREGANYPAITQQEHEYYLDRDARSSPRLRRTLPGGVIPAISGPPTTSLAPAAAPQIPLSMRMEPTVDTSDVFKMMQQRALSEQEDRVAGAMQKIPSLSSDRRVQILRAMGLDWRTPGDRPATVTTPPAPQPPTDWQAEQLAAELRANPELADRIAMEKALNAKMGVERNPVQRDPNSSLYANLATATLNAADRRAAREAQGTQPAYRDESRIAEVAAARQAQRARAQELVSAMARGRRGYVTPENALTMALMRNPQSAAILAQGNMKSQEIMGRLMEARMNAEADANRSRNWIAAQERMAKANNDSEEKRTNIMAGTKAPELSAESLYNIDQIKKSGLPQVEKDRMTAEIIRKDKANPGAAPTTTAPSVNLAALPPSFGDNPTMSSITAALGKLPDEQLTPEFLKKIIADNPSIISENALRDEARNNSPGLWDAAQRLDVWFSPTDPAARQRITDDMFKALPAGKQRALKILKMLNQARLEAARR